MTTAAVTGARGFIGKHLVRALRAEHVLVHEITRQSSEAALEAALEEADVVYHLAGANRPENPAEFEVVNVNLTKRVVERVQRLRRNVQVVLASSIQVERDTAYGRSKLAAEDIVRSTANVLASIYRLPNVFGSGCRPLYNSVVATFCHFAARGDPLPIVNPDTGLRLVHISDVVASFLVHAQEDCVPDVHMCTVGPEFRTTVGDLADRIETFAASRKTLELPDFSDPFTTRLYSTYLSYLPRDAFAYSLEQRTDSRGVLAEFIKSQSSGQLFVSRTRPGVTRGHHWHSLKTEKFLVLEGEAIVRFEDIDGDRAKSSAYRIQGTDFRVLDIPPGFAHSIENIGTGELIVLFWASEKFDQARPDTQSFVVST